MTFLLPSFQENGIRGQCFWSLEETWGKSCLCRKSVLAEKCPWQSVTHRNNSLNVNQNSYLMGRFPKSLNWSETFLHCFEHCSGIRASFIPFIFLTKKEEIRVLLSIVPYDQLLIGTQFVLLLCCKKTPMAMQSFFFISKDSICRPDKSILLWVVVFRLTAATMSQAHFMVLMLKWFFPEGVTRKGGRHITIFPFLCVYAFFLVSLRNFPLPVISGLISRYMEVMVLCIGDETLPNHDF